MKNEGNCVNSVVVPETVGVADTSDKIKDSLVRTKSVFRTIGICLEKIEEVHGGIL